MREWTDFYSRIQPDVIGCPEPTIDQHLIEAAQKFCRRSSCWRQDLDAITTTGAASYAIVFPTGAKLAKLLGATLGGNDVGIETADGTTVGDRRRGTQGSRRVLLQDPFNVTIMPTQEADVELILHAALQPSDDATGLPDVLADQYKSAICAGALSTLLTMNRAEWANPALAALKESVFLDGIGSAKLAVWKAWGRNTPRTVGVYF
jgi:hypothetical protein